MRRFKGKKWAAAGLAGFLLVSGGVAFALINLTGTGTGSGPVTAGTGGTANISLSVHVASTPPLIPGATVAVDFDATNPNANAVNVTTITLVSVTSSNTNCNNSLSNYPQFTLAPLTENTLVAAGKTDYGLPISGALTWVNLPNVDQGVCLGQPLSVNVKTP